MKVQAAILALAAAQAQAFTGPVMTQGPVTRGDFAKVASAAVVGAAAPALAVSGTGPKQNVFGIVGWGGKTVGGGGLSSPYAETSTYSAYSPYTNTDSGKAVYKLGDEQIKRYIEIVKDCQKRFQKVPGWADKGEWEEIRTELTRKAYSLRGAMNALAKDKPAAEAAAKAYYQDLELITVSSRRKQGAAAKSAYEQSVKDLTAYLGAL